MSVLTRITTRAKQIYKKGKSGVKWITAIKRASAELKGKVKTVKRKARRKIRRVGKGPTITPTRKLVIAGIPREKKRIGKTIAKGFSVGSDTPNKNAILINIRYALEALNSAKYHVHKISKIDKKGLTLGQKALIRSDKKYWQNVVKTHKQNIINFKRLL